MKSWQIFGGLTFFAFCAGVAVYLYVTQRDSPKTRNSVRTESIVSRPNTYDQWIYGRNRCFDDSCVMDFSRLGRIEDFERWVVEFRTGGTKDDRFNKGFAATQAGGSRVLGVTQSNTFDPGGSRRTEAKVAVMPVGDYQVVIDVYVDRVPDFDTTISQIKCGSGEPPINVKMTARGGVRVQSGGGTALAEVGNIFGRGWHRISYTIENSKKALTLTVDGKQIPINNAQVQTDCAKIPGAGKEYWMKIGMYEDAITPGFTLFYKIVSLRKIR